MRNPPGRRNLLYGITAGCVVSFLCAMLIPTDLLGKPLGVLMGVGGLSLGIPCLIGALSVGADARAYNRLVAGQGLLTQWIVDPQTWREFIAFHDQVAKLNPRYPNAIGLRREPHPEGMEVVLGEKSLIVDGDFHHVPLLLGDASLEELSLQPGPPVFVNMHVKANYYSRTGSTTYYYALRFPVPPQAVADANAAVNEYIRVANTRPPNIALAGRKPLWFRNGGVVCLVLGVISAGIGFGFRNQPQSLDQMVAAGLAVAGVMVGLGGVIFTCIGQAFLKADRKDRELEKAHEASGNSPQS